MARTGYGQYAHLFRGLDPPLDLEVVWYNYNTDEFYYYDYTECDWIPYSKRFTDRIDALERIVRELGGNTGSDCCSEIEVLKDEIKELKKIVYVNQNNLISDSDGDFITDGNDEFVTDGSFSQQGFFTKKFETESSQWIINHNYGLNATIDKVLSFSGDDLNKEGFLSRIQYLNNQIIIHFLLKRTGVVFLRYNF